MGALLAALLAAFEPIIDQLIAGLGTDFINLLEKYFPSLAGNTTAASSKATDVISAAERITGTITTDPAKALAWVNSTYPTFAALESAMPGSMQAIQAKYILMSDESVPHAVAAHAVQIGYANQRVKSTSVKKP